MSAAEAAILDASFKLLRLYRLNLIKTSISSNSSYLEKTADNHAPRVNLRNYTANMNQI